MNRVAAVRDWARNYIFDAFHVTYTPIDSGPEPQPQKCPVSAQELFREMEAAGQDTKLFRQAKEAAEAEWKKLWDRQQEDHKERVRFPDDMEDATSE